MVKVKRSFDLTDEGLICIKSWISQLEQYYASDSMDMIRRSIKIVDSVVQEQSTNTILIPYNDSLEIASILYELNADELTVAAGLLFKFYTQKLISIERINLECSDKVASILLGVENLLELRTLQNSSPNDSQVIKFRRMLLAIIDDIRIVLVKLAERVYVLRSIHSHINIVDREKISNEVLNIYAPLAGRLGLSEIKWELEDRAFYNISPKEYKSIALDIGSTRVMRESFIDEIISFLNSKFSEDDLDVKIYGRVKHIFSIWKKKNIKELEYSELYDIQAVRVLVKNIEDCYKALGILNDIWESISSEYSDYIATPKENGYQSIHAVFMVDNNQPLEVQIRTHEMHESCESGIAAHWRYKEGGKYDSKIDQKVIWLRSLLEWKSNWVSSFEETKNIREFIETDERVYVFTPDGDVHDLPLGSTVLDFAYHVHTMVGHRCRGAKIDGKIVPIYTKLKTGNTIEILMHKNPNPSQDWFKLGAKYIFSNKIRSRVARWFKLQSKSDNAKIGRERIISDIKLLEIKKVDFKEVSEHFNVKDELSFFASIETGALRYNQVLNYIDLKYSDRDSHKNSIDFIDNNYRKNNLEKDALTIYGVNNILSQMAGCCCPIPGDSIMGYITNGRGVTIHRSDCDTLRNLQLRNPEKIINVTWGKELKNEYPAKIIIKSIIENNYQSDIYAIFSEKKIKIISSSVKEDMNKNIAFIVLQVRLHSTEDLQIIINKLKSKKIVQSVERSN